MAPSNRTNQRTTITLILLVFIGTIMQNDLANAQTQPVVDTTKDANKDKINFARPQNPVYIGYEIAVGVPVLYLKSNIRNLQGLCVPFIGGKIGSVISNEKGKLKGYAGLYYSDSSVPFDFDLLEGGMSANVYVLRLKQGKYHTIEPYIVADISYHVVKYYGCYLPNQSESDASMRDNAPFLGNTASTQIRFGAGFEYQMENTRNKFIHLFTESGVGMPVSTTASNHSLAKTNPINQIWVSLGLNFGMIR